MEDAKHVIDATPFIGEILYAAAALIAVFVGSVIYALAKKVGLADLTSEKAVREAVSQLLGYATKFALARLADREATTIKTDSDAVAEGVRYALKRGPGTLKRLGIADTEQGRADLAEMIQARLLDERKSLAGLPDT